MKKVGGSFLIINLVISLFAFAVIMNIGMVSAFSDDVKIYLDEDGDLAYAIDTVSGEKVVYWYFEEKWELDDISPDLIENNKDYHLYGYPNYNPDDVKEAIKNQDKKTPSDAQNPTQGLGNIEKIVAMFGFDVAEREVVDGVVKHSGLGFSVAGIVKGAGVAIGIIGVVKMLGPMFTDNQKAVDAVALALAGGLFVGQFSASLLGKGGVLSTSGFAKWLEKRFPGGAGGFSLTAGAVVAFLIFYQLYRDQSQEVVIYTCYPWEAPAGGKYCEECNKQGALPCSEYQCRSLGQSCQLLNPGTGEEKCTWVNRKDVEPPIITPWEEILTSGFKYSPTNAISPPDRGVKIVNTESTTGCAKPFTPLTFGIEVNEPAKCKLSWIRKDTYEDMEFYFGGSSLFRYNHSQTLSIPSLDSLEAAYDSDSDTSPISSSTEGTSSTSNSTETSGSNETTTTEETETSTEIIMPGTEGDYQMYVRCMDANGNKNIGNFVFQFCVEAGPDTTPPLIVTTSILNGMPIAYNTSSTEVEVYVNEPATCKWSRRDQSYDKMEEEMSCSQSVREMNAQMLYPCSANLTGLENEEDNVFYFRCKDQPFKQDSDRNVNAESYEFTLIGTQPLVLDSVGPNGTIKDSTDIVEVVLEAETSAGYNNGESACYYSETGDDSSYILFFDTNSHQHKQELYLSPGNYEYYIRCVDLGGNFDINTTKFTVESDSSAPIVVRTYHEESYLKLVTDEKAECVYDNTNCNYQFEDGTKMAVIDETNHFTDWSTKTNFYIKCQDEYGNKPFPNECSIVTRPFELYSEESF